MSAKAPQTVAVRVDTAQPGACRSCGAPITWYRLTSERLHPFTGDPVVDVQRTLLGDVEPVGYIPASASHFVTCPDAKAWRKPR